MSGFFRGVFGMPNRKDIAAQQASLLATYDLPESTPEPVPEPVAPPKMEDTAVQGAAKKTLKQLQKQQGRANTNITRGFRRNLGVLSERATSSQGSRSMLSGAAKSILFSGN